MTANERLADLATVFNDTCKKFSLPNGEMRLDIKYSLSDPEVMAAAGRLVIECAAVNNVLPEVTSDNVRYIVGLGSGGAIMEHSVASASLKFREHGLFHWKHYNNPDIYGPNYIASYGAETAVGEVLIVDDVIRGGTTLSRLHDLMSDDLLVAKAAVVLVDHSSGTAEMPDDVPMYALLKYDIQSDMFVANPLIPE